MRPSPKRRRRRRQGKKRRLPISSVAHPLSIHLLLQQQRLQVIGNKWDTYLELLQAEYSER